MNSPRRTGRVVWLRILPTGAATSPVDEMRMAPCVPFVVKIPGAAGASFTVCAALVKPPTVTVREASLCLASSQGTWKLICVGETKNRGAATPFRLILASPSKVGNGTSAAAAVVEARFEPNTVAILPGATGTPAAKLAPFTTALTIGGSAAAATPAPRHSSTLHVVISIVRVTVPSRLPGIDRVQLTTDLPRRDRNRPGGLPADADYERRRGPGCHARVHSDVELVQPYESWG